MKRLLFLCEFATLSGGENSLLTVLPHLVGNYHVTVASPPEGPLPSALSKLDLDQRNWTVRDRNGQRRPEAELKSALLQLLGEVQADLLHANSLSMARFAGRYHDQLDVPLVGHLRDMLNLSSMALTDIARCDRLLSVSVATRNWFVERGLPETRVQCVYNGVDLDRFRPRAESVSLAAELGLPVETRLIGAVGQLVQRKGWFELLEAVDLVLERCADLHLVVVGDRWSQKEEAKAYEQQVRSRALEGRLAGHVHFLGYRDDVPKLLPQMTLLVHAARQEPLGRVLLEAAASGLPVVATDVGGTSEIFPAPESGGVVVPLDAPERMAAALSQLLSDECFLAEMAAAGRRNAETRFSAATAANSIQSVYEELFDE